ncbi:MAG: glutamate--cysteine ligase [Gammaproteobacteria bacterium]|jgi:carboxylate-amine ligase|nr:glutamate--cysteine ligase [Gammaproteobacteria bacterium]
MTTLDFKKSHELSLGMELELQIISPENCDLLTKAKDLIRSINRSYYKTKIKPEITQSMIEINSSIHLSTKNILEELRETCRFLTKQANQLDAWICGGGTHPFQNWSSQKIFPTSRFRNISRQYGYLAKRFTVFALHIHIGCTNEENAIYLTHMLSRYIPQFIALSASSPFYRGIYTGFHSTRVNVVSAFPLSGVIPLVRDWQEFSEYYNNMYELNIINSMKDLYWDIRPKPEFGTVEIRVCDMPLTLEKVVAMTAYIQTIARYILTEKPHKITDDLYLAYNYNRFQASRYGYEGDFICPFTKTHEMVSEDILNTLQIIESHADYLGNTNFLLDILKWASKKSNDAKYLKNIYSRTNSLEGVVKKQCETWARSNI